MHIPLGAYKTNWPQGETLSCTFEFALLNGFRKRFGFYPSLGCPFKGHP
jgi:hypothetical protein